ncbi:hypothetical protein GW17_00029988, partial [Ensete ventricosum]
CLPSLWLSPLVPTLIPRPRVCLIEASHPISVKKRKTRRATMTNDNHQDGFNLADLRAGLALPQTLCLQFDRSRSRSLFAFFLFPFDYHLQNLAGKHTDVLETLNPAVRKRVEVLMQIQSKLMPNTGCHSPSLVFFLQNKHDELEAKFFEERAVLEAKYQKLYEPLYAKVLFKELLMLYDFLAYLTTGGKNTVAKVQT